MNNTIIFSGGGTLGPVMPLLAITDTLKRTHPEINLVFVGTREGVEEAVVLAHGVRFVPMISAKLHRYVSLQLFWQPMLFVAALFQAVSIILREKPSLLMTAGGFVSVPLHFVAWIAGIPTLVHQMDFEVGLANRLMVPFAKKITTVFPETVPKFSTKKTIHIGNPIRPILFQGDADRAIARFHLESSLPTILMFGGGTGAMRINVMVSEIIGKLVHTAQVIHVTGSGKDITVPRVLPVDQQFMTRYHRYEFLMDEEMADAFAVADLVVARAGLSSISEIMALQKASILIPIHNNHQEHNANYVAEKNAALYFDERDEPTKLLEQITTLMNNPDLKTTLQTNALMINTPNAAKTLSELCIKFLK